VSAAVSKNVPVPINTQYGMSIQAGKMNSLQLLRAIAVLLVVYCHVLDLQPDHNRFGTSFQQHFFYLQNFGAVGVDIFFVISGFIITTISYQYAVNNTAGYFLVKRMIRIIPVYWLVSLFPMVYHYLKTGQLVDTTAIIKTICFFPFFDHSFFDSPILFVGWTLSFEMFFYVTIFISMLVSRKWYIRIAILLLLVVIAFNYATQAGNRLIIFFGNGIILEFLLGALAGLIFLSPFRMKPVAASFLLIAGVAALLASVIFGYGDISECGNAWNRSLSLYRVVLWGLPAALLVTGAVFKEKRQRVTIHSWWIFLGDASYSIYLTHSLIVTLLYEKWIQWGVAEKLMPDLLIVVSLLLTAAAGCIFYKLVELPLLRFLNRKVGSWSANKLPSVAS
jgi:exopolysaccharide production protein ExoZ